MQIEHTRATLAVNVQDFINDDAVPAPANLLQIIHPNRKLTAEFVRPLLTIPDSEPLFQGLAI
jgi:hypothetical protein